MVRRVLVVVALAIFLSAEQAQASGQQAVIAVGKPRIAGHVLSALQRAKPIRVAVESVNADQPLQLTIVLNRDDAAGFDRFLADVYNPLSPNFRHFLSPKEISDRFGPSIADYDLVAGYLQDQGFAVTETSPNRMTMVVTGTRGLAEKAFQLNLGDYELSGRRFFANDADPALPAVVAPRIQAIVGLNDLAQPNSTWAVIALFCFLAVMITAFAVMFLTDGVAIPLINILASQLARACLSGWVSQYVQNWMNALGKGKARASFTTREPASVGRMVGAGLDWRSVDGAGQTIGLLEFDSFLMSDVSDWLTLSSGGVFPVGQMSNLSVKPVNGGIPVPGSGESEVLVDVDTVMRFAPGSRYVVYEAPFSGGASFQSLFNAMINDQVTVISNSWSYCEDQTTLADVQSVDSILATAAASGISVFNGSGDTGSTCLDGAPNTIGVPSDSPHATAVGGTTPTPGVGFTYGSESWWDGSVATPPSGQGGFGVSQFFARPTYQNGFNLSAMRSVPDVAAVADPRSGIDICQADKGGCPAGLSYGGTSMATPVWAAMAALLNEAHGSNLGLLNPVIYPFGNTSAFHSATSMGSDFAHVGLGSPNLNALSLDIDGESAGSVSAADAIVAVASAGVPADGASQAVVQVNLIDDHGNAVSGKTVSLSSDGSAVVSAPSGPSSVDGGAVTFTVTDSVVEPVTFHATDVTDGLPLTMTTSTHFVAPAATSGNVVANPTTVVANGVATTAITVTLHDVNDNGAVGKTVTLSQGAGRSVISGPTPATTDSNGQVVFTATDTFTESVTYAATDVTDGDLPVPDTGTSTVSFTGGSGSSCAVGQEIPQTGWAVTSPETGFALGSNCVGVSGTAWDPQGNLWAMDYGNGNLYKFPPVGGSANVGTLVGTVNASNCPHGLAFSKDGQHLYLAEQFCGFGGDVVELSMADASIVKHLTTADAVHCATGIATDPISGDLFVASPCQSGNDLWRIANPESNSPSLSVYASPGRAIGMNFTPDGTIWTEAYPFGTSDHKLIKISGTNSGSPGTVTVLSTSAPQFAGGVLPVFNPSAPGNPSFLFVTNGATGSNSGSTQKVDLTQNPPVFTAVATAATGAIFVNGGPDGCAYVSNGDRVDRITAADGSCNFASSTPSPRLALSPVSASPSQASTQTLTAQLEGVSAPTGTPVVFQISGANAGVRLGHTDLHGQATIDYSGVFSGIDSVVARATVDATTYTSNTATIDWSAGHHVTFLGLNFCPTAGTTGTPVTLSASLFDASADPMVPVSGASVHFALGAQSCDADTDGTGLASCAITPDSAGTFTLTASYAGSLGASRQTLVVRLTNPVVFDSTSSSISFSVKCAACIVIPLSDLFEGVAPAGQSSEPNGIIEPGETKGFQPRWINVSGAGFTGGAFTGDLSNPVLVGGTLTTPASHAQYPNLAAGADGSCTTCYSLGASFTSGRPQLHVDATVLETPSIEGTADVADAHSWTIHIGNSFTDVPTSNIFYTYIETMLHNSVTLGVGGRSYDPLGTTPRNQMAAFIARADAHGDGNVPASGTVSPLNNSAVHGPYDCSNGGKSLFADVAPTDLFCRYIHYLINLNVTIGCDTQAPPSYCPSTDVTRANMAVFISRAIRGARGFANPDDAVNDADTDGASRTYDCTNGPAPFLDVPLNNPPGTNPSCRNIGELWVMHVIDGDGAGHFLPNNSVSRQEMAKFIVNGERLSINNP